MTQVANTFYTLSKILGRIRTILDDHIKDKGFWLKVEIANINFHRSGHVYIELAETNNGKTIAQCKGMIWSYTYRDIQSKLKKDTLNVLKKGNEIMCYVNLSFDEKNGLAVFIRDIDMYFNLGEIEKRRQESTIEENQLSYKKAIKFRESIIFEIKTYLTEISESLNLYIIKNIKANDW